jgi:hypothetical protein
VLLGALTGGYMLVDGIYATQTGSYIGSSIGPWSILVGALGIHPRSYSMVNAFIIFGICWLGALAFYFAKRRVALAVMAAATLWYLPFGTLFSLAILGTYVFRRKG